MQSLRKEQNRVSNNKHLYNICQQQLNKLREIQEQIFERDHQFSVFHQTCTSTCEGPFPLNTIAKSKLDFHVGKSEYFKLIYQVNIVIWDIALAIALAK